MRKKTIMALAGLVLAGFAIFPSTAIAANNDEYKTLVFTPGNFNYLISDLPCRVKYVKGECKITTRCIDKKGDPFTFSVNDGKLEMKMNAKTLFSIKDSEVIVSAPTLVGVEVNGTGKFETGDTITTDNFRCQTNGACKTEIEGLNCKTLQVRGNGTIKVDIGKLNCGTIDAQLNGAGKIEIDGKADKGSFTVNGAGKIDISGLQIKDVSSKVNGIGSVTNHK